MTSIEEMEAAAERGSVVACSIAGIMRLHGAGDADVDLAKALKYLTLASSRGASRASFNLGLMYERGSGVTADRTRALDLFREAAERGEFEACIRLARIGRSDGDVEVARRWYRAALEQADRVDAPAELDEAAGYIDGNG